MAQADVTSTDNVFTAHDKNAKVYDSSAKRLVRRVMEGYHGTVFAYGMTGTGKTFSMQGTATSPGVIPLAITDIFSFIRETPHREFLLRVSYLEIYNEKIHDLLSVPLAANGQAAVQQQDEIKLREDGKRGVYATPLKEEIVQSPTQLLRVIARGDHARRTSSTQYNARSSRSHAVVQIVVESRERQPTGALATADSKRAGITPGGVRVSTLSLIDLAGSERAAENKERRTEGAHINKSLLTLGTVVSRLSSNKDKSGQPTDKDGKHLPYRDSKLTRLLQPALSGNSLISILCTIQIGSTGSVAAVGTHIGENLNTLKFAARARNNIVSHAKKAEEAQANAGDAGSRALLDRYRIEIQDLRKQLESQKVENDKAKDEAEEKQREQEQEQRHEEQMLEMQLARTALKERIGHLNRLILSSKSIGVNAGRISSSASTIQQRGSAFSTASQTRSVKSSASTVDPNDASRRTSSGSTATAGPGNQAAEGVEPIPDVPEDDEVDESIDSGEGSATLNSQVKNLQGDLADKNRYIATLEKRLLQARRSSRSRLSAQLGSHRVSSPIAEDREDSNTDTILQEKDSEIADLRARLDDKERMVAALRSAARKRDTADMRPDNTPGDHASVTSAEAIATGSSSNKRSSISSHVSSANASDNRRGSVNNLPRSSTSIDRGQPQSPASPVGRVMQLSGGNSPKREVKKTHGVDEMTRMLDEMIRQKVESGGGGSLPHSRTGSHAHHASGSTNGARSSNETQRQANGVNSRTEMPPTASGAAVAASRSQPQQASARAARRRSAEPTQLDNPTQDADPTPRPHRTHNPPTIPINTQTSPSSPGPSSPLPPIPTQNPRPSLSTLASSKAISSPSQASSSNFASPALSHPPSSLSNSNSNSNTPSSLADPSRSPSDTLKSSPTVPPFGETRSPAVRAPAGDDPRPMTAVPPVPKVGVDRLAGAEEPVEPRRGGYNAGSSALRPPQAQQWRRERDESCGSRSDGTAIADEVQDEGPDGKRLSAFGASSSSSLGQMSASQRSSVGLGIETRS